MRLYIGNKNYSSWSMRPWVLLTHFEIPFEEVKLRLSQHPDSAFKRALAPLTPVGLVPLLLDGELAVWDSLAIVEYVAEKFPDRPIWPRDRAQRARARSLCAEMHSGFAALRDLWPMNVEARLPEIGAKTRAESAALRANLARVEALWRDALAASGGPFLMGAFSAVDAFYAPVVMRFRSYATDVASDIGGYLERVCTSPAVARWIREALAEHDFVDFEEVYRKAPPRP